MYMDTDWLKKLKVGDKVIVNNCPGRLGNSYEESEVEKITPTGRIKVKGEDKYFINGHIKGVSKWASGSYLREYTPESYKKYIQAPDIISVLRNYKWTNLTPDQLIEIHNKIKQMEGVTHAI